jgi:hypothetical protein
MTRLAGAGPAAARGWGDEFASERGPEGWADELAREGGEAEQWADELGREAGPEGWAREFSGAVWRAGWEWVWWTWGGAPQLHVWLLTPVSPMAQRRACVRSRGGWQPHPSWEKRRAPQGFLGRGGQGALGAPGRGGGGRLTRAAQGRGGRTSSGKSVCRGGGGA